MTPVPVLEIGGTHVTAALVETSGWSVARVERSPLDAGAPAGILIDGFLAAGLHLGMPPGTPWGIAIPDPFDYAAGIGRFAGHGKFEALDGLHVGAALRRRLGGRVTFVNDADAFALGEWTAGSAVGARRCVGITLGTGVGSGWLVDGRVADPVDPPGGRIHRLRIDGAPLEEVMSRRAIRRAFAAAGGDPALDVREIAELARAGATRARHVLDSAVTALATVLAPRLAAFEADAVVVGGSMCASWDVLGPPFAAALTAGGVSTRVRVAARPEEAPLIGAAQRVATAQ